MKINEIEQDLEKYDQVFLIDEDFLDKIRDLGDLNKKDIVVEIGPGLGQLTKKLAEKSKKVIALEIDTRFKEVLDKMPKNVEIIFGDAKKNIEKLDFNKIVSSPPYNLCEPLIRYLIKKPVELVILVTPSGFYDKMIENPIFSSFLRFEKIKLIPRKAFSPVPRIDSEIIKIIPIELNDNKSFLIKDLYLQENAKLKNALRNSIINLYKYKNKSLTKNQAREIIKSFKIPENILEKNMTSIPLKIYKDVSEKIKSI